MSDSANVALVPFHGHQILTVRDGERVMVAMRPVAEALGLSWPAQFRRIKAHPVLGPSVAVTATGRGGTGVRRDQIFMPLEFLNGWLFTLPVSRVKPELRERLIEYQRDCFRVLAEHWGDRLAGTAPAEFRFADPSLHGDDRRGERFKIERERLGYPTRKAFAERLHTSVQQVAAFEEFGVTPRQELFIRMLGAGMDQRWMQWSVLPVTENEQRVVDAYRLATPAGLAQLDALAGAARPLALQ